MTLPLHGAHHVSNALAAAAVAIGLGADVDKTAAALSRAVLVASGRMEVTDRPDQVRVINDAFNANPDSVKAALGALEAMSSGRRTIAVLGPSSGSPPQPFPPTSRGKSSRR
ncbi:cyanophycin synthetase [Streptomyces sp. SCSIO 30461]|uniref:glutamate ligase domain-containing protein n=1 Tax=Streptomyces sp. SCSIO 30461 TaxID=3118085 RepID=UPI0030D51E22